MTIQRFDAQRASTAYTDTLSRVRTATPEGVKPTQSVAATTAAAPAGATKAGAVISLSPEAKLFAKALASAHGASDVRADRVAAVQARLAKNNSSVDVDALAAKMLGGAPQA